jgi:predicted ATPase
MKIESIKLKNFKAFKDVEMKNIPNFWVVLKVNGSRKSTSFSRYGFVKTKILAHNLPFRGR